MVTAYSKYLKYSQAERSERKSLLNGARKFEISANNRRCSSLLMLFTVDDALNRWYCSFTVDIALSPLILLFHCWYCSFTVDIALSLLILLFHCWYCSFTVDIALSLLILLFHRWYCSFSINARRIENRTFYIVKTHWFSSWIIASLKLRKCLKFF